MKTIFYALLLVASSSMAAPQSSIPDMPPMLLPPVPALLPATMRGIKSGNQVKFDFQAASVPQVIQLVYMEALNQPYVIDPAILKDERVVSFRFDATKGDLRTFWRSFMDSLGFTVTTREGVDFLAPKKTEEAKPEPAKDFYVYRTKYRSLSYLVDLLSPLFKPGAFGVSRGVRAPAGDRIAAGTNPAPPPASAAALLDHDADTMIFQGTQDDIAKLEKVLPQIDTAAGEVIIKAVVYEVTTGKTDGNAFSLALGLLGGRLGINLTAATLANSVTFKSGNIDLAFAALAGDSRFKAVSTPRIRVKSGSQARLTVGDDVPTLGAVTIPQGGAQAVQSIEYRSSGVILSLLPTVRESGIDVLIDQQISDFSKTQTGVNNSPTLSKRALTTTVTVADGELVVLGGLTQDKRTTNNSGLSFLPHFMRTSNDSDGQTEIILMMQVSKLGS